MDNLRGDVDNTILFFLSAMYWGFPLHNSGLQVVWVRGAVAPEAVAPVAVVAVGCRVVSLASVVPELEWVWVPSWSSRVLCWLGQEDRGGTVSTRDPRPRV